MGHGLLWIGYLVFSLAFFATFVSLRHHISRFRWVMLIPVVLPLIIPVAWLVFSVTSSHRIGWNTYFSTLLVAYIIGVAVILRSSGIRYNPERGRWGCKNIALVSVTFFLLTAITMWNIDTEFRDNLQSIRREAESIVVASQINIPDHKNAAIVYQEGLDIISALIDTSVGELKGLEVYYYGADYERNFNKYNPKPKWFDPELNLGSEVFNGVDSSSEGVYRTDGKQIDHTYQNKYLANSAIANALERLQPALNLIRKAAEMPECRFEHNYGAGCDMPLVELSRLRRAGRLLRLDAVYAAYKGDMSRAMKNILAQQRIAGHLKDDPILVSLLVGGAIEKQARMTFQEVLLHSMADDESLKNLDKQIPAGFQSALVKALQTENSFVSYTLEGIDSKAPFFVSLLRAFIINKESLDNYMKNVNYAQILVQRPYYSERMSWDKFDENIVNLDSITSLFLPNFKLAAIGAVKGDASRRLQMLACSVLKFRNKHGKYPKTIREVMDSGQDIAFAPVDPFTGEFLKIETSKDGKYMVLYSLGADGLRGPQEKNHNDDIEFRIPIR